MRSISGEQERKRPAPRPRFWEFAQRGRKARTRKKKNRWTQPRNEVVVSVRWGERFSAPGVQKAVGLFLGAFVGLTVLVGGFSVTRAGASWWAVKDQAFLLTVLDVENHGHLSSEEVLLVAGIEMGQSLLTLDLDQARRKLEEIPSVSFARLERTLPNRLRVVLEERVPLARLGYDSNWVVDRDGMVMEEWAGLPSLPYVEGLDLGALAPGKFIPQGEGRFLTNLMDLFGAIGLNEMVAIDVVDLSDKVYPQVFTTDCSAVTISREMPLKMQLARWAAILAQTKARNEMIDKMDVTTEVVAISFFAK